MARRGGRRRGGRSGRGDIRTRLTLHPPAHVVAAAFEKLGKQMGDWREPLRKAAPDMAAGIEQSINSRGGAIGERWNTSRAGSQRYQRRKSMKGVGPKKKKGDTPLVLTGKLKKAVTKKKPVSLRKKAVSVGVRGKRALYGPALNFGAYPFMGWSKSMLAKVQRHLDKYVEKILLQAGRSFKGRAA